MEDKIYEIDAEMRQIEKEVAKFKANYALKRAQATQRLTQAQEVLLQVTQRKELAEMSFQALQQQIQTAIGPQPESLELPQAIQPTKKRKKQGKRLMSAN